MAGYGTPEFGRVEIAFGDRDALQRAAAELRTLADGLDHLIQCSFEDDTRNFLAWGRIKDASKRLRGAGGKEGMTGNAE